MMITLVSISPALLCPHVFFPEIAALCSSTFLLRVRHLTTSSLLDQHQHHHHHQHHLDILLLIVIILIIKPATSIKIIFN